MKKLASILSLELQNLRMFFRTDSFQLHIFESILEIVLTVILLGLAFLVGLVVR